MATLGTFTAGQVLTAAELNAIGTWTSYSPTFTNLTIGNASVSFKYTQINKLVIVSGSVVFGTTSTFTGSQFIISLPVTAANSNGTGSAYLGDTGSFNYLGVVYQNSATQMTMLQATGGYFGLVNDTNPFTWSGANNDSIRLTFTYEAA